MSTGIGSDTVASVTGGFRSVGVLLAAVTLAPACSPTSTPVSDQVAATTMATTTVPHTGPTDDLAPSQRTSETAPPPEIPPSCEPSDLSLWTAQVLLHDGGADAVIRVRNDGDVRCEVDVSGSPFVDPLMEPDVWLEPGSWADVVVGARGDGCDELSIVALAPLDVNGEQVEIRTAAVVACGWQLTAFYPNDVSDEPCGELAVAAVDGAVVVRNDGFQPCRLGSLVSVTGDDVTAVLKEPAVAVPVLAGGDVVAFSLDGVDGGCADRPVELRFDTGVAADVEISVCAASIGSGPPQPWLGGPGDPTGSVDDPTSLLTAIEPFVA